MNDNLAVKIEKLTFTYPDGRQALRNISLDIKHGETVAIVGPNGAGKSTLAMHLNGLYLGDGKVTICGIEVTKNTAKEVRGHVGFVFQDADDQLFMPTVFDDVAFGPLNMGCEPDQVHDRVHKALDRVQLSGFDDRAPHHLSGGEKRAASIATVLSMDPDILVLDEPTSTLDARSRRSIMTVIRDLPSTCIIITHDLEFVLEVCDRTIMMDNGWIVADGPSNRILAEDAVLKTHGLEMPVSLTWIRRGST